MKFNITAEIDWLSDNDPEREEGEEISIDAEIKRQIVNAIVRKLSGDFQKKIEEETKVLLQEQINGIKNQIGDHINNMLSEFGNRPVVITDKYGDVQERHESVNEMIKTQYDLFLDGKVDDNGKPITGCSYGKTHSRIEWMITKRIDEKAKDFMRTVIEQVDAQLKKSLDAEVKARVSAKIMEKLDMSKLI